MTESKRARVGAILTALGAGVALAVTGPATGQGRAGRLVHGLYVPQGMTCADLPWDHDLGAVEDVPMVINAENDSYAGYKRVLGPTSMIVDFGADAMVGGETVVRYTLCPPTALSEEAMRWPQERTVAALPITAGLYRVRPQHADQGPCEGYSEYILLEPTRMASIGVDPQTGRRGSQVSRFGPIRQLGPKVYQPEESTPFLVKAPDRLEWYLHECGNYDLERVDPRGVPAAKLPRW